MWSLTLKSLTSESVIHTFKGENSAVEGQARGGEGSAGGLHSMLHFEG